VVVVCVCVCVWCVWCVREQTAVDGIAGWWTAPSPPDTRPPASTAHARPSVRETPRHTHTLSLSRSRSQTAWAHPPAADYAPSNGSMATTWVLYFKGGGWCYNEAYGHTRLSASPPNSPTCTPAP
jgi:hypothetical protein